MIEQAYDLFDEGRFDLAKVKCAEVLKADPNSFAAHFLLGAIEIENENFDTAIRSLDIALQLRPGSTAALFNKCTALVRQKSFSDAELCLRVFTSQHANDAEAHALLATVFLEQKKYEDALRCCEDALTLAPEHFGALLNHANALSAMGEHNLAISDYLRLVEMDPENVTLRINLAQNYQQNQDNKAAIKICHDAMSVAMHNEENLLNIGAILREAFDYLGALSAYKQVFEINGDQKDAYIGMSVALMGLKNYAAVIELASDALKSHHDFPEMYGNKGVALMEMRQIAEAKAAFLKALELKPNYAEAYANLGIVYKAEQNLTDAENAFRQAISIDESFIDPYISLGAVLVEMKRQAEAEQCIKSAIEKRPDISLLHYNLGCLYFSKNQIEEAALAFRQATQLDHEGRIQFLQGFNFICNLSLCDWSKFDVSLQAIEKSIENDLAVSYPHCTLFFSNSRAIQRKAGEIFLAYENEIGLSSPFTVRAKSSKIRLGFVSSDLRDPHPVGSLTAPLLEEIDRSRFEIFIFATCHDHGSETEKRVKKVADFFDNYSDASSDQILQEILKCEIDILIDLNGYTDGRRRRVFSRKAAPVQVNFLGYSATTGANFMDYIIGDHILIPPDHDCDYSEKVIRLPNSYMLGDPSRKISSRKLTRADFGLPQSAFVFCDFNKTDKILPAQFDLWMRILNEVSGSVLWLSSTRPKAIENLRHEAKKRDVNPDRLIFAARVDDMSVHLARHRLADLFLDTFPHNAHATANDALWAGLPILTRMGETFASRVAGSLVNAVGMPDMIASSEEEYVQRAVEIATVSGLSASLKRRLAANLERQPLFDIKRYTRNLEKAFSIMHERSCLGLLPQSFDVDENTSSA